MIFPPHTNATFCSQHSMLYFFHHYELPAILQQAQIQQLGRVHTVNIVLRNVPNNNNNNNQNPPNNPGIVGGGENAGNDRGGPAPGPAAARPEGGGRRVVPPMVNLVFRNMAGGVGNNRNGNASLSFVFRNVRNIVQSLQQNTNASSAPATNVTSTTTTVTAQSSSSTTTSVTTTVTASQGSSTSESASSASRIVQTSALLAEVATVSSSLSSGAIPVSQRSDAALSNSVITNSSSTSSEFTSEAMSDISPQRSSRNTSSSLHNLRPAESNDIFSPKHEEDTADYKAVPVQMPDHLSSSKDTERVNCSELPEASSKFLQSHSDNDHNSDLALQSPFKSTREPHINTRSSGDDVRSYALPRPPEEVSRQSTFSAHLDDNIST